MRRWPYVAGSFVMLSLLGSCAVWMASPPEPPEVTHQYRVCQAAGFHGYAIECYDSPNPPGSEPGTFAPTDPPLTQPQPRRTGGSSTYTPPDDPPPGFQGTPDLGAADVGPADSGAADGGEPGASD